MARRRPGGGRGEADRPARPTRILRPTNAYKRDLERLARQGRDMAKLRGVLEDLVARRPLAQRHADHPLKGEWKGYRDCHVEPDWVLIYGVTDAELVLVRTGSHADLFGG